MLPTDLLIDGYNLLHAAGLARSRYARGDLQRARQSLLRRLFELLTAAEIARTAVVFDARHPPPHLPANWCIHGLRVVYARPHGDADIILEELINGHSAPRQLTVVSSDHRLHRAARARRADAVDSEEFLEFLERRQTHAHIDIPPPEAKGAATVTSADITAAELAYWMGIFGDVKVSDLAEQRYQVPEVRSRRPAEDLARPVAPPAPSEPPRRRARATAEPVPKPAPAKATPELFSAEWIADLQTWVDQLQKPRGR